MLSPKQQAMSLLTWVRSISEMMLKDIPESGFVKQACPTDNHPLWVLGHLASTDAWIGGVLGIPGISMPDGHDKLFGGGSKPLADPKAYPKYEELKALFDSNRKAVLAWLEGASASALETPLKEKTGGFTTDPIDAMHKLAWHEGYHFGQVASVRKALNLKPIMG
jgi:hypothetical protein